MHNTPLHGPSSGWSREPGIGKLKPESTHSTSSHLPLTTLPRPPPLSLSLLGLFVLFPLIVFSLVAFGFESNRIESSQLFRPFPFSPYSTPLSFRPNKAHAARPNQTNQTYPSLNNTTRRKHSQERGGWGQQWSVYLLGGIDGFFGRSD